MMGTVRRVHTRRHADQDRARDDAHRELGRRVWTGRKRGGGGKERQKRRGRGADREEIRRAFCARETRRAPDRQWNRKEGCRSAHGTRSCKIRNLGDSLRFSKNGGDARRNCVRATPYVSQFRRGIPEARGR